MYGEILPALDCHAHIAADATKSQIDSLGRVVVFGMTRSLKEAAVVATRSDPTVVWGCGVHPRDTHAITSFDAKRFDGILSSFALVGEIGLDRRGRQWNEQVRVLRKILEIASQRPVVFSIHSAGCPTDVVDLLAEYRTTGAILHWFKGSDKDVSRAVEIGCAFSVNTAMTDSELAQFPAERLLPETDFPVRNHRTGRQPGDMSKLESRIAALWDASVGEVRARFYRNLRDLIVRAGALERLEEGLADHLLAV